VRWTSIIETTLEGRNPFARMLSSHDLLKPVDQQQAPAEDDETAEEAVAAEDLPLPDCGDRAEWEKLAKLLTSLPTIDKSTLGQEAAGIGLTKKTINEKFGLGLEGKHTRRAWDEALDRLEACGFLVRDGESWVLAEQAESTPVGAEDAAEPARSAELEAVIDRFVGSIAAVWEGVQ
jgi:hypothetical protein